MTTAKELFKPRYSGIIFDLDGTLINSLEDLVDACNQVMLHYGLELKSYQEGKKLIGRGLRNLIKRAVTPEMAKDEALVDEAVALMKDEYAKRYTHKTVPTTASRIYCATCMCTRSPSPCVPTSPTARPRPLWTLCLTSVNLWMW